MKLLPLFVLCFVQSIISSAQDPLGTWSGILNAGVNLRVVFHIQKDGTGFNATMDSPDQQVKDVPLSGVKINGQEIVLEMAQLGGAYSGRFINDTTIEGQWKQGPATLPLTIVKRIAPLQALRKKQTPVPPFPYRSEDVTYSNADHSVTLAGTLTIPNGDGKYPAVILITGSGQQDRDETIMGHKPFAVIADYLTRRGMAVLRVDDRGVGGSQGDLANATSMDFAHDVEAGIRWLQSRTDINPGKIGLLGHSEGGLIAAYLAGSRKDIAFVVLMAGPGVTGLELMAEQNKAYLMKSGLSAPLAEAYGNLYTIIGKAAIANRDSSKSMAQSWNGYQGWLKTITEQQRQQLGLTGDAAARNLIRDLTAAFQSPWMHHFLRSNPAPYLEKTSAAVLALNGEKDIQVVASQNIPAIEASLKKSPSKSYSTHIFPGLNHLFQHCNTCTVLEYGQLEETIAPAVLDEIGKWLQQQNITK